ncbi:MAG: hypothetical protein HZA17_05690 [Nitrospirae bacterium]|nr:hypothetical protein [Nitrospirota bacterium]
MNVLIRRSANAQSLHDYMVKLRANALLADGYSVSADLPGFPQPPEIRGHIPDIYAVKSSSKIISEAETCDTICSEHTRDQYTVFSNVPGSEFHVIVPHSCLEKAQGCATQWRIRVDRWWYQEGY